MKCDKCGHENEASSLFCQNCGNPIRSLEKWETGEPETTVKEKTESGIPDSKAGHPGKNKGIIIAIAAVVGVLLVAGGVFGFLNFQKTSAIGSGLKNGEALLAAQNYTEALVAFDGVLKLDPNNAEAMFGKAKAYSGMGNYKMANTFFEEAILKEKNEEKLKIIFDAYIASEVQAGAAESDLFALLDRATEVTGDSKYADQKSSYTVKAPSFNLNPGTYQGEQKLEIVKADANDQVFYTTDGSQPTVSSIAYTEPITLTKGEKTIKAIEVNVAGFASKIIEGKYVINDIPTTSGGAESEGPESEGGTATGYDYTNFSLVASSTLPDMAGISYYVGNVMDGSNNTAWVEGVAGDGVGEYVQFVYNGTAALTIHGVAIKNGYVKTTTSFSENGSVRGMVMYVNTSPVANMILERIRDEQVVSISPTTINPGDSVVFVIDSVVPGPADGDHDTAITEIRLF
ncbi:MAG: chitobiase/beta-hexosaminidase C-terminal domain-containing protein [Acetobacterium sp.]|uniref:NADase-type glycan-binding domain-containing protein n=1 Tax=Acetobacterium sp. TaxID=1872094 RepID=UPI00324225F0